MTTKNADSLVIQTGAARDQSYAGIGVPEAAANEIRVSISQKEGSLMFAKCSNSNDYHLVRDDRERTLCGQGVAPVIIDRPVKSLHLHLTNAAPTDLRLCEECASLNRSITPDSD